METIKAKYVRTVIETFAGRRYGSPTEARVSRWLTDGRNEEAKELAFEGLWKEAVNEPDDDTDTRKAYARWTKTVHAAATGAVTRYLRIWQAVAACLFIAVGVLSALLLGRSNEPAPMMQAYCAPGQTLSVDLPDGTQVLLNGNTTVVYPERFAGSKREVLLMGEANFKVAKDAAHPFIVKSDCVSVTALGTEFNVKAYPHTAKIASTLIEGKVRVNYGTDNRQFVLEPSEQLTYDCTTGAATLSRPMVSDVTAWQRGELVFSNSTLSEILRELEQRFSHDFVYNASALPSDRYTFRFRKGMTLPQVMAVVSDVVGNISVTVDDSKCRVRRL